MDSLDVNLWNANICGKAKLEGSVNDARFDGKFSINYEYQGTREQKYIEITTPSLNSEVDTYEVTLKLSLEEYPSISTSFTMNIEVLPCEIKSTSIVTPFADPVNYMML